MRFTRQRPQVGGRFIFYYHSLWVSLIGTSPSGEKSVAVERSSTYKVGDYTVSVRTSRSPRVEFQFSTKASFSEQLGFQFVWSWDTLTPQYSLCRGQESVDLVGDWTREGDGQVVRTLLLHGRVKGRAEAEKMPELSIQPQRVQAPG